jgi:RHS repeat-associated protein
MPAPLYAAAGSATKQFVASKVAIAKQQIHSYEVMQDLKSKMAAVKPADFVKLSKAAAPPMGTTIIDEIGRLRRAVPASDASLWRTELHGQPAQAKMNRTQADYYAQRHIWLGEYLLAYDRAPREAAHELRQACGLTNSNDKHRGTAEYDLGLCIYYEHNYRQIADYYHHMLGVRPAPVGLGREDAELMFRRADGCLGYHQANARLGIPEPPVLDPLCGAASLAASLRTLRLGYDQGAVVSACNVSEEGSSLQDLLAAGRKLGAATYSVASDDKGLMLMPKPVIAYIEQDHFISVIRADKKGVGYLCSDCGAWPGGEVDVTWNQWHHMEPGIYAAVVRHGSDWDQFLTQLPSLKAKSNTTSGLSAVKTAATFLPGVQMCSVPSNNGIRLVSTMSTILPVAKLIAHLSINGWTTSQTIVCGPTGVGTKCGCPVCCPLARAPGHGGSGGSNDPGAPPGRGGNPGQAPGHSGSQPTPLGASAGDPVNLATGEEEYAPDADLTVYNPIGPSVSWARSYDSMRAPYYEPWYEFQDFGNGWSQSYNMGVDDPTNGGSGSTAYKYIFMPNGARVQFVASAAPTSAAPIVQCQVQIGYPYLVSWNYNSSNSSTYYVITDQERTQYVTSPISSSTLCGVLAEIIDRNGNAIHFNYGAPLQEPSTWVTESWPLLASITDSNGSPLLVINRAQDGTGAIASVDDRYGRTVYYHVGYYSATAQSFAPNIYDCDHVSQIEPTDTPNAPDRYHYGYTLTANADSEQLPKLASISVPNPTGSSTPATATIAYDPTYATVSSITDANGNELSFESVNQYGNPSWNTNYEEAIDTGANMAQAYITTVSYDGNMSQLTQTDGKGNVTERRVYGDANNPYSPTTVTDGNGRVSTFNYTPQGIGETSAAISPRGVTTANAWNYSNFALGELTKTQDSYVSGGVTTYKAPTSVTYYEPNGLAHTVTKPTPGTVDSSSEVNYQYTYNSLGDVTQVVSPGNNAAASITTTFSYGLIPHIGEVLTVTDNLGHATTFTYDSQANTTSVTDALSNTTYFGTTTGAGGYNIANQSILVTRPATGQTGSGNSYETTTYQYPGGPKSSAQAFDESGTQVRQIAYSHGGEGETLIISGSTEFASYSYDALYRLKSITDGNARITNYYYNGQGYLDSVTYPGYAGPTPAYDTSSGKWSNVAGGDSVRASSYDHAGDLLTKVDGRGVVTTYTYADPENHLTNVSYNVSGTGVAAQPSASLTYDGFGRLSTVNNGVSENLHGYTSGSTVYPGYDDNDSSLNVQTGFYNSSGSLLFSKNVSYTYNADGSKASTVTPAGTFTYAYDGGQRPTSIENPFSETTSWSYINNNWLSGQTLANGGTTSYTYNVKALITQLVNTDGGGNILSNFSGMTYDGVSNRTALAATVNSDTTYSGTTSYVYDVKDELTNETSTRNGSYTNTFAYDGAENPPTFRSVSGKTYNSDNQKSNTGFSYDGNGNPTTYNSAALTFDVENRLTSVDTTLTGGYGADSLRASCTTSSGTTYCLYDNDSTAPVCEMNSSGTITATNTYGVTGLISRHTSSGSIFYELDPQGTVVQRLNSAGSNTITSTADAFGNVANSAPVSDPFGYEAQAGYYTDQSTGLILTTFRYYDPVNGRFLNRDPAGYAGGINIYGYTGNNSVNSDDPYGLWGFGVLGSGEAEAGTGYLGVGANGSGAIGLFGGPSGLSIGTFLSAGAFAGWPGGWTPVHSPTSPGLVSCASFVMGTSAGFGGGLFFTNAGSSKDLGGRLTHFP